jgi:FkbM family methyltransferase
VSGVKALTPRRLLRSARHRRQLRNLAGPKLLRAFAEAYPEAFFVEVGANDGEQHDHLRPFILSGGWSGIMVEPVPYVFERLQRNYAEVERVTTANVAISDRDGQLPFYHLISPADEERASLPDWYDGIGSFSRAALEGHAKHIPDIEDRIVAREVEALTFASLCRRYGVETVDLIVIDTEGYDWEILRSIDLALHRPRLVVFEHFHLSPEVREECRAHMSAAGYATMEEGFDTFCLDTREVDALTLTWRRLRPAVAGVYAHDEEA